MQQPGEPGNDGALLAVRGIATYNDAGPTIYVDGFEEPYSYLQYMQPSEIQSISVLKDGAAVAPFGMKGANGVIWVVTKQGQPGKPHVQIQMSTGFQQPTNINKPLGSYDYARLYNEAVSNDNNNVWTPVYSPDQLQAYKNGSGTNIDWYNEVLRQSAPLNMVNASFNGGDSIATYFVMLGYMNDQGLYNVKKDVTHSNALLNAYNVQTNLDFHVFRIFEGTVNIGGRLEDRSYPNYNTNTLWNDLASYPPDIYPVKNKSGTWTGTTTFPNNPVASINGLGYNSTHDRTLQANFGLKEKMDFITKGLYLKEGVSFSTWTEGTYNVTMDYARYIDTVQQTPDKSTPPSIYDDYGTNQWYWQQFTGTIGYDRDFGLNHLTGAVNYLQYIYKVDANQNGSAGENMSYGYQNVGGRLHYDYNNLYEAELGFAFSGSDNFASGHRWGFYPALSAAWIISNEPGLKNNQNISYLKLRASVGKSGNDNFSGGRYLYQLYYNTSGAYATGNSSLTWHNGMKPAYTPNPGIFAEQSLKYDIGIDAIFWNRLNLTVDGFIDKHAGIVTQNNSIMATFGASPPYENVGRVTNKGLEASVDFSNHINQFHYQIGGNILFNANKINYMAEVPPVSSLAAQTGNPVGSSFGYMAQGFYNITDFNPDGTLISTLPQPTFGAVQLGDIKYKDINGDGIIDQADLVKVGKTYWPEFVYAFNVGATYRGFDLSVLFQGDADRTINLLSTGPQAIPFVNNSTAYAMAEGAWAYYPQEDIDTRATATYPRLTTRANNNNYVASTFWMKNAGFLRLRNVELGYVIPQNITKRVRLSKVRLFVSGVNLHTWSSLLKKYHMDPESQAGYPVLKSFNFGLNVDF
jgi:TonB-linked SusC/RagA family outer membrane protein